MKLFLVALTLISVFSVNSQNLNYQKELERMVKVPNTPEAEAFTKYGNTSVSMYSGTPNISIPIYTISGRELDLPISLTYDASGIKVAQLATQAGLGWNLNVGGRVSRIINGLVDDYAYIAPGASSYTSIYNNSNIYVGGSLTNKTLSQWIINNLNPPQTFNSKQDAIDYFKFLKDISDNKLDVQPDYFSFNALGYSDHFVFDFKSRTFKSLDNPRTKVVVNFENGVDNYITSWIVTTEDGTKFYFNQAEKTHAVNYNDIGGSNSYVYQDYNSSWLLTKIESPNLKDIYVFTYTDLGLSNTQPSIVTTSVTNELSDPNPTTTGSVNIQNTDYNVTQLPLTQITHNGKKVVDITLKQRFDIKNQNNSPFTSAIDNIAVYKFDGISVLKRFTFNHSYFGITSGTNPAIQDPSSIRLKLDSISIKSANNTNLSSYTFEYFSPELVPDRASLSQDYLGFYNGKTNSVLYPAVTINNTNFSGADRSPVFSQAIKGTLKKLIYPTGGFTEFAYEAMKTTYTTTDVSSSTQDVTYAYYSLTGGIGSSANSGFCALDQYGAYPKVGAVTFSITTAGNYNIDYTNSSGGGEAYLFQRSSTAVLPYNQVINQSNCNELVSMIWATYMAGNNDNVYLTPGIYQITLAKGPYFTGDGIISLKVHRTETISNTIVNTGEVERAGIRIKNIQDYSDNFILSSQKDYQYTTTLNGSDSSGQILFDPVSLFYSTATYQVFISNPDPNKNQIYGINTMVRMTRGGSWSGGDRPHIAYSKVFEIQKAGTNNNGYIEHNFNVDNHNGIFSTGVSPNANLYYNNFGTGKESLANVYKADNTLLNTDGTGYFNTQFNNISTFENSTIYLYNNIGNEYKYVHIKPDGNGHYYYFYDSALFVYYNMSVVNANQPAGCYDVDNYCMPTLDYSSLNTRQTYAQGNIGGVSSKINTTFYNGVAQTQTSINTYDAAVDYLLRQSENITSAGDTLKSKQYYPKDFSTVPYTTMVSKNMLTPVVQTENYKNSNKLGTLKNDYLNTGSGIFPNVVYTAKGTNNPETRIKYEYSNGNVVNASQFSGDATESHISYIWGYDNSLPIAKLENIKYSDIPPATITALQSLSNSGTEVNDTTEQALRVALNALRTQFPNALITTYTYDPNIGVKSITDPRGQTTYFHYDEFNRLEYVTDNDGKVLSKNQYHFRTN